MMDTAGRPSGSLARGAAIDDDSERRPPQVKIPEFSDVDLVWDDTEGAYVAKPAAGAAAQRMR